MPATQGLNHLGLAVGDLDRSVSFFVKALGWKESGKDSSYPRTSVSDGTVRLTIWQIDRSLDAEPFNRRKSVGLHHLALEIESEDVLNETATKLSE